MERDALPLHFVSTTQHVVDSYSTVSSTVHHAEPRHSTPKSKIYRSLKGQSPSNKYCGTSKPESENMQDISQTASRDGQRNTQSPGDQLSAQKISPNKLRHNVTIDLESITIQKQRTELQLLMAELRDRDKELNEMVAVHQKQMLAWEEGRQRVLTLEQRCTRLENELQKRNDIIRTLTKRIKSFESQRHDCETTLESTQQQLLEQTRKVAEASFQRQALEEKNQSLNSSVLELSSHVGQLQAREQELNTILRLKDKDIIEATDHITQLTSKFKKVEMVLREARLRESDVKKEMQECKQQLKRDISQLKDDISEKTAENNDQREEIIRLKQENQYLQKELSLTAERERRKDQLLDSIKSKQERVDMELRNLRQV
ncbi:coiled-coil domain-containing protein 62 [Protopterus annectens]|uniref:coiled-coil domain-containing protein 62 n=1 Tax=Protopterus annectens TaxID=7888 RepID=UPI001CFA780B|nr:coiled-coil domain-containing protein 62 [Protopterus annectens]